MSYKVSKYYWMVYHIREKQWRYVGSRSPIVTSYNARVIRLTQHQYDHWQETNKVPRKYQYLEKW